MKHDTEKEFAVRLTVHPGTGAVGGCRIVPDNEFNFEIRNEDEIHMVRPLAHGERLTLLITLGAEFSTSIRGLSFGTTSEQAQTAKPSLDTGGEYYGATPFQIAPGEGGSAQLTVINDPNSRRFDATPWYFDIWPVADTPRIDPKIYNKGDGTDGGSP